MRFDYKGLDYESSTVEAAVKNLKVIKTESKNANNQMRPISKNLL